MYRLIDTHAHLEEITDLEQTIAEARSAGVIAIIAVGSDLESNQRVLALARVYKDFIFPALGLHPGNIKDADIKRNLEFIEFHIHEAVAIGEIGLDYARNPQTKEIQKELLIYELSLARETGLPVNIHCREAHQDMMDILRQEMSPDLKGSVHGFSGDRAALKDWLDVGFYISIGGRRGVPGEISALPEVIVDIPLNRLLTESEGANGPAGIVSVAEKLASIRGITVE